MELKDPTLPPLDSDVKRALRLLGEPIVVFAEAANERRERLRKAMIEGNYPDVASVESMLGIPIAVPLFSATYLAGTSTQHAPVAAPTPEAQASLTRSVDSARAVQIRRSSITCSMVAAEKRIRALKQAYVAPRAQLQANHRVQLDAVQCFQPTKSVRNIAIPSSTSVSGSLSLPFTTCASLPGQSSLVVSGSVDGVVSLWDANTCLPLASESTCASNWGRVNAIATHPTRPFFFTATMFDRSISVWAVHGLDNTSSSEAPPTMERRDSSGLSAAGAPHTKATVAAHEGIINRLAVCPHGLSMASTSADGTLRLWDVETLTAFDTLHINDPAAGDLSLLSVYEGYGVQRSVLDVKYHPDGGLVSTTDDAGRITTWDLRTGSLAFCTAGSFGGHMQKSRCVAWSPCGVRLASGGDEGLLHIWDARMLHATETSIRSTGNGSAANPAASSPVRRNPTAPGAAGPTAAARLAQYKAHSTDAPLILVGHSDSITSLSFAPPLGSFMGGSAETESEAAVSKVLPCALVSTSLDGTVCFWDANTGLPVRTLREAHPVRDHCWTSCCDQTEGEGEQRKGNPFPALLTVSHSKYWSLWELRKAMDGADGMETNSVRVVETDSMLVSRPQFAHQVENNNIDSENDDDDDDDDEDEMAALRKKPDAAAPTPAPAPSGKPPMEEDDDDDDDDDMALLRKQK